MHYIRCNAKSLSASALLINETSGNTKAKVSKMSNSNDMDGRPLETKFVSKSSELEQIWLQNYPARLHSKCKFLCNLVVCISKSLNIPSFFASIKIV